MLMTLRNQRLLNDCGVHQNKARVAMKQKGGWTGSDVCLSGEVLEQQQSHPVQRVNANIASNENASVETAEYSFDCTIKYLTLF